MEIKQLQYFIAAVESKSLNQAAKKLYTSQPNVSKSITLLEQELRGELLIRSYKGTRLTPFGEQVYLYAKNIIKDAETIRHLSEGISYHHLKIASYPSNMIARGLSDYYVNRNDERLHIEFRQGTVEDVIQWVYRGISNIGVLYVAKKQKQALKQQLENLRLTFHPLKECEMCLYVGPNHLLYHADSVKFEELKELKYVQGLKNYFDLEENLEWISLGAVRIDELRHMVHTNSDSCTLDMLLLTDLVTLGLDFYKTQYHQYDINGLHIQNCDSNLQAGYVLRDSGTLYEYEEEYIKSLRNLFDTNDE